MKVSIKLIWIVCITGLLLTACGNGGDDDPTPVDEEMADETLEANTWNVVSVISNGNDFSNEFTGFTVSFSNGNYTANNTTFGIWDNSGTYNFSNVSEFSLTLSLSNGNSGTAQTHVNGDQIIITISVPATIFDGGRVASLAGTYEFVLKK